MIIYIHGLEGIESCFEIIGEFFGGKIKVLTPAS